MKRLDLIRYLVENGCALLREGGRHSVYVNRIARKATTIPRHREINDYLARKICRDLDIPEIQCPVPFVPKIKERMKSGVRQDTRSIT
jgi:mRNA interferase HicA